MLGHCYHFSTGIDSVNDVFADDLYDADIAGPDDKCEDVTDPETAKVLMAELCAHGLRNVSKIDEFDEEPGWVIKTPEPGQLYEFKTSYFRNKFETIKTAAGTMTICEFIQPGHEKLLKLEKALSGRNGDMVSFTTNIGTSYMTLDSFIRKLEPSMTYYLSGHCVRVT